MITCNVFFVRFSESIFTVDQEGLLLSFSKHDTDRSLRICKRKVLNAANH